MFQVRGFTEIPYTQLNLTALVSIGLVRAHRGFAFSIKQLDTLDYEQSAEAYEANAFSESNWEEIKEVGLAFAQSPANSALYQKVLFVDQYLQMDNVVIMCRD